MMEKQALVKIKKMYKIIFSKYNKNCFDSDGVKNYFISYLKYLRDIGIITTKISNMKKDLILNSLLFAVGEYEESISCINNYYNITPVSAQRKDLSISEEETNNMYAEERQEHLSLFFSIVRDNFDIWVYTYGNKI